MSIGVSRARGQNEWCPPPPRASPLPSLKVACGPQMVSASLPKDCLLSLPFPRLKIILGMTLRSVLSTGPHSESGSAAALPV